LVPLLLRGGEWLPDNNEKRKGFRLPEKLHCARLVVVAAEQRK